MLCANNKTNKSCKLNNRSFSELSSHYGYWESLSLSEFDMYEQIYIIWFIDICTLTLTLSICCIHIYKYIDTIYNTKFSQVKVQRLTCLDIVLYQLTHLRELSQLNIMIIVSPARGRRNDEKRLGSLQPSIPFNWFNE